MANSLWMAEADRDGALQNQFLHSLLSMEPWAAAKSSVTVLPAPVRVPSQMSLAPTVTSVTSVANDKGDNEKILGLYTDLLAFALKLRKTPENLS